MNGVNASQQQQIVWFAVKIPAVESGGAGACRGALFGNVAGCNGASTADYHQQKRSTYSNALAALIVSGFFVRSYWGVNGSAFQVSVTAWYLATCTKKVPFSLQCSSVGDHDICCAWYYLLGRYSVSWKLLGSINIVVGFYSVMWGKAKEVKVIENSNDRLSATSSENAPLLPIEDE